jgi:glycosyltransferase involved in cell wall biosynthesis
MLTARRSGLMRVACVGNMNNSFFALVRHLRDRGVDADLLLTNMEIDHFLPAADTYDDAYRTFTKQLGWGSPRSLFLVSRRTVLRDLSPYDAVIGCGMAPAHLERIGRRLDVFAPYGSDLFIVPWPAPTRSPARSAARRRVARLQRNGIRRAREIFLKPDMYTPDRDALQALGVSYRQAFHVPIYYPEYDRLLSGHAPSVFRYRSRFDAVRRQHDVVVFSPARHLWRRDVPHRGAAIRESKGNDLLLRGIARLAASGVDVGLITFDYGADVAASRDLVERLEIGARVHWFPKMPRRELVYGAHISDVGADQFPPPEHGAAIGGSTLEMLVLRLPVLGRLPYTGARWLDEAGFPAPPLLNAGDEHEIRDHVVALTENGEARDALAVRSREWVLSELGTDAYLETLNMA